MEIKYHKTSNNSVIAELTDNDFIISKTQDALDLMGNLLSPDCIRIIIPEKNLHKDFFNLKTGLAGDVLQKFSNYRIKLAVTGDFSKYKSKSLQDFIRESNKGNMIYFLDSVESALMKFKQFDIWIADLEPQRGSETGKIRPVLIFQTNLLKDHPSSVICPITTNVLPESDILRVHIKKGTANLQLDSDIMIDQIRAIANRRLTKRIGELPRDLQTKVKENIKIILDLV